MYTGQLTTQINSNLSYDLNVSRQMVRTVLVNALRNLPRLRMGDETGRNYQVPVQFALDADPFANNGFDKSVMDKFARLATENAGEEYGKTNYEEDFDELRPHLEGDSRWNNADKAEKLAFLTEVYSARQTVALAWWYMMAKNPNGTDETAASLDQHLANYIDTLHTMHRSASRTLMLEGIEA